MVSRVRISINSSGQEVEIFHGAKDENSSWNFATGLLEGSLIVSGQYHVKSATFLESIEMFESLNYLLADSLSWGPQKSNECLQFRVTEVWPPLEHSPFLSLCHGHCLTSEQRPWGRYWVCAISEVSPLPCQMAFVEIFRKPDLRILLFSLLKLALSWSHLTSGAELIGFARPFH